MDSRLRACVAAGDGLATAEALRAHGFTTRQITAWVRTGVLVAVRRGVYTTCELWESWDAFSA
ncbi:MAG TPA: type IV toxin-antitoxin system AbiEi family antitoxin domain-containing protein, partial [Pedococcus sp.]|nr:type IV toxin-antitoxin system AbiEi family antitoxin domain-containing protein [Pedococcus sp.]